VLAKGAIAEPKADAEREMAGVEVQQLA